ncbi:ABC-type uncharacterized transport system auxiliary subunit [Paenibacillus endophyticus]|uniref:ABC-type uncharacterized transport system auxiliary subunit n=1 Tax=Paenibacillus endophyticus TaxID=1294268 RepID=A0A7W5CDS1_9BACL|nr:hypothetical protein [Paenibacillus endophyticus]MBB3155339.1 ABC-type uncharacterized transport system auxiliary subunit [Paenibacillus endophyticus]
MKKLLISVFAGAMVLTATACSSDKEVMTGSSPTSTPETNNVVVNETIKPKEQELEIVTGEAKHAAYNSVQALVTKADLVIQATFTGERETNVYRGALGEIGYINSISTIEVKKVFKGDLAVKTRIQTFEPGYVNENQYVNVEGYNLMNEKGKYVLFLRQNPDSDIYTVVGMYQGKYDLNVKEQLTNTEQKTISSEYLGKNVEKFNKLKQEVVSKFGE